jgi:hypothetical protein
MIRRLLLGLGLAIGLAGAADAQLFNPSLYFPTASSSTHYVFPGFMQGL